MNILNSLNRCLMVPVFFINNVLFPKKHKNVFISIISIVLIFCFSFESVVVYADRLNDTLQVPSFFQDHSDNCLKALTKYFFSVCEDINDLPYRFDFSVDEDDYVIDLEHSIRKGNRIFIPCSAEQDGSLTKHVLIFDIVRSEIAFLEETSNAPGYHKKDGKFADEKPFINDGGNDVVPDLSGKVTLSEILFPKNILKMWSGIRKSEWGKIYLQYKKHCRDFIATVLLKGFLSIFLISLISHLETNGFFPNFVIIWISIIFIDQITNIILEFKREKLGKILNDLFPGLLEREISSYRQVRGIGKKNLEYLYNNSIRISKIYAFGKLGILYSLEQFFNLFSVFVALLFVNSYLAGIYVCFMVLLIYYFKHTLVGEHSVGEKGEEKEREISEWIKRTVFLRGLGLSSEAFKTGDSEISKKIDDFIRIKIRQSFFLRFIGLILPGTGALMKVPFSSLIATRGIESSFFLTDMAKMMAQRVFAEKQIYRFTKAVEDFLEKQEDPINHDPDIGSSSMAILKVEDISVKKPVRIDRGKGSMIVEDVNFRIPFGTINFIGGASGSGKTALLQAIAQMDISGVCKGDIKITTEGSRGGKELSVMGANRYFHYISFEGLEDIFEIEDLLDMLENGKKIKFEKYLNDYMDFDWRATKLFDLSSGQMARIKIAFVLAASDAPILLLDQPFSWVDDDSAEKWVQMIKEAARRENRIVFVAEPVENVTCGEYDNVFIIKNNRLYDARDFKTMSFDDDFDEDIVESVKKKLKEYPYRQMSRDVGNAEILVKAFIENIVPILMRKNKVVIALHESLFREDQRSVSIVRHIERLKKDRKFKKLLSGLTIIYKINEENLDRQLDEQGIDPMDDKNAIFVFADKEYKTINSSYDILKILIEEVKGFNNDLDYYPLTEMIVITLFAYNFKTRGGGIMEHLNKMGIDYKRFNIKDIEEGKDVFLRFSLLPMMGRYDYDGFGDRISAIKAAIGAA